MKQKHGEQKQNISLFNLHCVRSSSAPPLTNHRPFCSAQIKLQTWNWTISLNMLKMFSDWKVRKQQLKDGNLQNNSFIKVLLHISNVADDEFMNKNIVQFTNEPVTQRQLANICRYRKEYLLILLPAAATPSCSGDRPPVSLSTWCLSTCLSVSLPGACPPACLSLYLVPVCLHVSTWLLKPSPCCGSCHVFVAAFSFLSRQTRQPQRLNASKIQTTAICDLINTSTQTHPTHTKTHKMWSPVSIDELWCCRTVALSMQEINIRIILAFLWQKIKKHQRHTFKVDSKWSSQRYLHNATHMHAHTHTHLKKWSLVYSWSGNLRQFVTLHTQ